MIRASRSPSEELHEELMWMLGFSVNNDFYFENLGLSFTQLLWLPTTWNTRQSHVDHIYDASVALLILFEVSYNIPQLTYVKGRQHKQHFIFVNIQKRQD